MAAITDIATVLSLTGQTVTDENITMAQGVISLLTGYDLDRDDVFTDTADTLAQVPYLKDQFRLRQAVAYEAAFVSVHPDVFTSANVSSASADGYSQAFNELGTVLAPLAAMAIRKLSKFRSRSVRVRPFGVLDLVRYDGTGPVPEWTDRYDEWRPM